MTRLFILIILSLGITVEIARSEPPVIFNGIYAKSLASGGFQHKSNRLLRDCGSTDPSAGAGLAAEIGSICQYSDGSAGTVFLKNAAADTGWVDLLSAVTGVPVSRTINTTTPLTGGGNLSADRTIAIPRADTATDGYLSSVDWNTFNGKQAAGNYITSLTSDVTASGPGAAAATIANDAVTNAKSANMAQATIKGRAAGAGTGDPTDLTGTQATAILDTFTDALKGLVPASGGGTTNFLRADGTFAAPADTGITQLTGDVTAGPGSGSQAATIAANAVTDAKFRQSAALSVVGRSANSTGNVADISAGADYNILRRSGTSIGFGSVDLSQSGAVGTSILGVANGGTGQSSYTNGQILIGNTTGNTLAKATLTEGLGIDVANGAGSITLSQETEAPVAIAASDIDWALTVSGGSYTKTLGANTTFTFSNLESGKVIVVRLTNTASNYTVTWPTVKWPGGVAPTMSTGAASDVYTFFYDGTDVYGSYVQQSSSGGGGGGATCTTFTPSITNSGSISAESGHYCISGKQLTGWFKYTSGTPDAAALSMTLPNSYDQAFSAVFRVGGCTQSTGISGNIHVLSGSGTALTFGYETGSTAGLSSVNANGVISNGVTMSCNFSVVVE